MRSSARRSRRAGRAGAAESDGPVPVRARGSESRSGEVEPSPNEQRKLHMSESDVARTVLPIPERAHVGLTTYDARDPDTAFPPLTPLRPPAGAPNVLIILLDD